MRAICSEALASAFLGSTSSTLTKSCTGTAREGGGEGRTTRKHHAGMRSERTLLPHLDISVPRREGGAQGKANGKQGRQRKNRWQGACTVARIAQGAWGNRGSLLKAIQTHKCYAAPKAALDKVGLEG